MNINRRKLMKSLVAVPVIAALPIPALAEDSYPDRRADMGKFQNADPHAMTDQPCFVDEFILVQSVMVDIDTGKATVMGVRGGRSIDDLPTDIFTVNWQQCGVPFQPGDYVRIG